MLRCGLLGGKLGHSYSPAIHHELGDYAYRLYEKTPEELPAFLTGGSFDGLNVTIPYKKAVMPYCAALSETARRVGCVNTLVRRADGTLYGDNTDVFGFERMLRTPVEKRRLFSAAAAHPPRRATSLAAQARRSSVFHAAVRTITKISAVTATLKSSSTPRRLACIRTTALHPQT